MSGCGAVGRVFASFASTPHPKKKPMTRTDSLGKAAVLSLGAFIVTSSTASAAGFAIAEQSVSGLAYGFAGSAAIAEDASTLWHNPAGMAYLSGKPEVAGGVHYIVPSAKFENTGSMTYDPSGSTGSLWVETQGADDTSDAAAVVPNLFYAHPISEGISFGLAVNAPFGLRTEYADGWIGRYLALETDLKTVNINPSISVKLSEQFAFGFGLSYQQADAVLSSAVDYGLVGLGYEAALPDGAPASMHLPATVLGGIVGSRGTTAYDGELHLSGDDAGYGYNFGVIWSPTSNFRLGLHYRSEIKMELAGLADFTIPAALEPYLGAAFADQTGRVDLTLPSNLSASLYYEVTERLTLLFDYTWTDWSQFQKLEIRYENASPGTTTIPENWEDTHRFSFGARFVASESIALRAGIVMDPAAVPSDEYRSPRIPDADRVWLSGGLHWQVTDAIGLDFSYAHIFVENAETLNTSHTQGQMLIGKNKSSVDIFSVGGFYRF